MPSPGFCQQDAGVLDGTELTPGAKKKFIIDVKETLSKGTEDANLPFPCGPSFPPVPNADLIELEDEEKFPGFHEHWLGTYAKIAKALDFKSQFMFAPVVMDPVAMATGLGIDPPSLKFPDEFLIYGASFPLLMIKLGFDIPAEKLPDFLKLIVPAPPVPNVPIPPIPPGISLDMFPDLFKHLS